jgi:hypothetical protein
VILRSDPNQRHTCKPIPYQIFDDLFKGGNTINPEVPKSKSPQSEEAKDDIKVTTKKEEAPRVSKDATKRPHGRPRKHPLPSFKKPLEVPQEIPMHKKQPNKC